MAESVEADETDVDRALQVWRQGDVTLSPNIGFVHWANIVHPLAYASKQAVAQRNSDDDFPDGHMLVEDSAIEGFVILSQTCDIVRASNDRHYVEVAPLIRVSPEFLDEVRRVRRPAFVYIPATAAERLIADLDRTMTVEKSVVATWKRTPGWATDAESRSIAQALSRQRARFAFPDDFNAALAPLASRFRAKHNKASSEGAYMRALSEIRVRAAPSWDDPIVQLTVWFVKDEASTPDIVDWSGVIDKWVELIGQSGRFRVESAIAVRLEDMTARDYVDSDRLDLDHLSIGRP
ncbi:MAG: hypothetical protein IPK81_14475 [Rhodospirillales bacterium]|nr:MAG: hypothetical protein IPK81_14475 [Rhodospirillales bacterium]